MAYIGSPYNFIPFSKSVNAPMKKENLAVHDRIDDKLYSGEIGYKIEAETPIIIGDGASSSEHFHKDEYGRFAIPGSSIRGLLRNNVQILSCASFNEDIDDYRLMFREVASGALSSQYKNILGSKQINVGNNVRVGALMNVQAGYIKKEKGEYNIYPVDGNIIDKEHGKMNYYVISERTIAKNLDAFPYYKKHPNVFQHDLTKRFVKKGRNFVGTQNKSFMPGFYEVSYSVSNSKISSIAEPEVLPQKGTMLISGKMQNKKVVYIIPKILDVKPVATLSKDEVKAFEVDFNNRLNTLAPLFKAGQVNTEGCKKEAAKFFGLPVEGEKKPIFYIDEGRLYIGYTPHLRLFFQNTIKAGYKNGTTQSGKYDMANSVFGCSTDDKGSYKSKISCIDAVAIGTPQEDKSYSLILAGPKPTSYLDYLADGKTYNDDEFELRGVKQYWLRNDVNAVATTSGKTSSCFTPLKKGTLFEGKIRFQNMSEDELGVLLWALKLESNCRQNIGKAKPYGFGRIKISDVNVKIIDLNKAYSLESLSWNPFTDFDADACINAYKKTIINGIKVTELSSVKAFFKMKNIDNLPNADDIRYMSIDAREYQSRTEALPTIDEVLDPSKKKVHVTKNNGPLKNTGNNSKREMEVVLTRVSPDSKNQNVLFGNFTNGNVFNVPNNIRKGNRVIIKVISEKNGRINGDFIRKA